MELDELKKELISTIFRMKKIHLSAMLESVSRGEFSTLEILAQSAEQAAESSVCVSDLAQMLLSAPSAVSRMLRGMEKKGLVKREIDLSNRRTTYVLLTEKGMAVRQSEIARLDTMLEQVISRMGEAEINQLIGLWNRLSDVMAEEMNHMTKGDINGKPV